MMIYIYGWSGVGGLMGKLLIAPGERESLYRIGIGLDW